MTIQQIQQIVGVTADGINGPKTQAAIKAYQQMLGVTADGIWGPNTQAAYDRKMNPPRTTTSGGSSSGSSSSGSSSSGSSSSGGTVSAAYNPNNGNPLYVGQTTTFEGKTYVGTAQKPTTADFTYNGQSYSVPKPTTTTNGSVLYFDYGMNKNVYSNATITKQRLPDGSEQIIAVNPDGSVVVTGSNAAYLKTQAPQLYNENGGPPTTQSTTPSQYQNIGTNPTSTAPVVQISSANLKNGSTGQAVIDLQNRLIALGYNIGSTGADGKFGPATEAAVRKYQTDNGLTADGIVGVNTAAKFNTAPPPNTNPPGTPGTPPADISGLNITTPGAAMQALTTGAITEAQYSAVMAQITGTPATPAAPYVEDYNKKGDTASSLYGQTGRNSDWEGQALQEESAISKAAGESGLVSSNFLKTLAADSSIVGFYVNALAYGGYIMGDILNDMKRRELISQGNTEAKTLKIIDPELNRNTYQSSAEGQKSVKDTAKIIPTFNLQGLLNPEILKYGANVPDELFKTLVPILDKNSQEFKDAVAKVKATYYDLATATLQATTEQDKAVADNNLKNFKEQINKQYGILLSDDATKAWGQIEALEDTMSTRNISGSGIEAEGIDNILASTRKQDQRYRDVKLTEEEKKKAEYYTSSASSSEIASLTDQEKQKYGLKPSSDILQKFSIENLKKENPSWSDAMIKKVHDSVIDENRNFRSTLYKNYYAKLAETEIRNEDKARDVVTEDSKNKELAAYRNWDQSQMFGAQTTGDKEIVKNNTITTPATTTTSPSSTSTTNNISPAATNAAANISASINTYNSNTGAKLTPSQTYVNAQGQTVTQGTPISTSTNTASPSSSAVSSTPKTTITPPSPTPSTVSSTAPTTYKIVYGDTLSAIAARNGTTTTKLAALNGISDPNKIIAGSTIRLK